MRPCQCFEPSQPPPRVKKALQNSRDLWQSLHDNSSEFYATTLNQDVQAQWEAQMSQLADRFRGVELENRALREAATQREEGFRQTAQQYCYEACQTADMFQAAAAASKSREAESRYEALLVQVQEAQQYVAALESKTQEDRRQAEAATRNIEQRQQRLQAQHDQLVAETQKSLDLSVQLANQEAQTAALAAERDGLKQEIHTALQCQEQYRRQSTPPPPLQLNHALASALEPMFSDVPRVLDQWPIPGWHMSRYVNSPAQKQLREQMPYCQKRSVLAGPLDPKHLDAFWWNMDKYKNMRRSILNKGIDPITHHVDYRVNDAFDQLRTRTLIHFCFSGAHQYVSMPWAHPQKPVPDTIYDTADQPQWNKIDAHRIELRKMEQLWNKLDEQIDTPRTESEDSADEYYTPWRKEVNERTSFKEFYNYRFRIWENARDTYVRDHTREYMLRKAALPADNPLIHRRFPQPIERATPTTQSPVGQVFVKLVTRDLIYSWLDKHAQRSAMIDRREPKMDLGTFERVYLEQMQKDDKFWDDTDKEDDDYPQGGGRNAFASSVSWPLDCTHVYMYVYTVVDPGYTAIDHASILLQASS